MSFEKLQLVAVHNLFLTYTHYFFKIILNNYFNTLYIREEEQINTQLKIKMDKQILYRFFIFIRAQIFTLGSLDV